MDEAQRTKALEKRQQLQTKIKVRDNIKMHLEYWLHIYDIILAQQINHSLYQLVRVNEADYSFWCDELKTVPLKDYNFPETTILKEDSPNISRLIGEAYPNTYPLRYMPALDELYDYSYEDNVSNLKNAVQQLEIDPDQEVYFWYVHYTPILKIKLKTLVEHAFDLLDFPFHEVIITPLDLSWMIFRSLEDEWRCGFKPSNPAASPEPAH